jgi:NADH dehydrogenase FAD-containing subunit
LLTGGVSLVRVTLTGALESSHPVEVNRTNLGIEAGAAFMWQSASLIVIVGAGATGVPFMQRMQAGRTEVELRPHLEPTGVLGIGFLY